MDVPYEPVDGESIEVDLEVLMVDHMTVRGAVIPPTELGPIGGLVFDFSVGIELAGTVMFVGSPAVLRQMGRAVIEAAEHVAKITEDGAK